MKKDYELKSSDERQKFETGSVRDTQKGKGRFDLLPPRALKRLARHFEKGAIKYSPRNWELGQPLSRYIDSAMRHLCSYMEGLEDEDHLVAAAWNVMAALETESRSLEGGLPSALRDIGPCQPVPNIKTAQEFPASGDVSPPETAPVNVYNNTVYKNSSRY